MKDFTVDDIIDDRSLFKYGRKVYSNVIMQPMIQKWIDEWETFDTEVPESGAWQSFEFIPIHDPSLAPQVHEQFASMVKLREYASIEDLDMTIHGEAAWFVIEIDIVKNDSTTEEQEKTWSLREKRSNLNDPEWMDRRRKELADQMLNRHNNGKLDPETMQFFLDFAPHLDENWKMFQELCDKEFNPPKGYKLLYTMAEPEYDETIT